MEDDSSAEKKEDCTDIPGRGEEQWQRTKGKCVPDEQEEQAGQGS